METIKSPLTRRLTTKDFNKQFVTRYKEIRTQDPSNPDNTIVKQVDTNNTRWLKMYPKGFDVLFDPALPFDVEGEEPNKEVGFTKKSQVTQANSDTLLEYCQSNYEAHEYEGMTGADMKKLIIEKLNF
jgi:hypothetical protein